MSNPFSKDASLRTIRLAVVACLFVVVLPATTANVKAARLGCSDPVCDDGAKSVAPESDDSKAAAKKEAETKATLAKFDEHFQTFTKQLRTLRLKASFMMKMGTEGDLEFYQTYDLALDWPKKMSVRRRDGRYGGDIVFDGAQLKTFGYLAGDYKTEQKPNNWLQTQGQNGLSRGGKGNSVLDNAGWGPSFVALPLLHLLTQKNAIGDATDKPKEIGEAQYLGLIKQADGAEYHQIRFKSKSDPVFFELDLLLSSGETPSPHKLAWSLWMPVEEKPMKVLEIGYSDWVVNGELAADEFVFIRPECAGTIDAEAQQTLRQYAKSLWNAKTLSADAEFHFKSADAEIRQTNSVALAGHDKFSVRRQTGDGGGQFVSNGTVCSAHSYSLNRYRTVKPLAALSEWRPALDQIKRSTGQGTAAAFAFLRNGFLENLLAPEGGVADIEVKSLGIKTLESGEECVQLRCEKKDAHLDLWFSQGDAPELRKATFGPCVVSVKPPDGRPGPARQSVGEWTVTYSNWARDVDLPEGTFDFTPPEGATREMINAFKTTR